jgi:hypothetical protein
LKLFNIISHGVHGGFLTVCQNVRGPNSELVLFGLEYEQLFPHLDILFDGRKTPSILSSFELRREFQNNANASIESIQIVL